VGGAIVRHESERDRGLFASAFRFRNLGIAALGCAAITLTLQGHPSIKQAAALEALHETQAVPVPPPWTRQIYEANCAVCHGDRGDGNGPAAGMFLTRPRDFRSGVFKFRSTPSGSLPTDEDLVWTITHGVRWTAMIARSDLSESERIGVMQYIKTFFPRFATETPRRLAPTPRPQKTSALLTQGRDLYRDADCIACHGEHGRGDGRSSADMKDDWGWPIVVGDLTWRPLKRGSALEQTYLTIAGGLSGTPMPAFGDSLNPNQVWSLVYYLESLVPAERRLAPGQLLGEEQQGRMALHMGGMMGPRGRGMH
jgi:cytochrome c oxidase cbb3-type subunit 2